MKDKPETPSREVTTPRSNHNGNVVGQATPHTTTSTTVVHSSDNDFDFMAPSSDTYEPSESIGEQPSEGEEASDEEAEIEREINNYENEIDLRGDIDARDQKGLVPDAGGSEIVDEDEGYEFFV